MIQFTKPYLTGREKDYISSAISLGKFSGDGSFTKQCQTWLEIQLQTPKVLLTTSCTDALELAALLIDCGPGDEIIIPSYTFVSSANAFALRGSTIVFVDVSKETANISVDAVIKAITPKTKAILSVNYAGWSCELDRLKKVATHHNIFLIEDAAQSILAKYKNQFLGTFGDIGCISFHETKNIHCGEGGAILINNPKLIERAEILREKGTNRAKFLKGEIDKYTWVSIGSSFLPSELNAAFLLTQLESAHQVNEHRKKIWNIYADKLSSLNYIKPLPENEINGHIFGLLTDKRETLMAYLKSNGIQTSFHYPPLHRHSMAYTNVRNHGDLTSSINISDSIVRLPLHCDVSEKDALKICTEIRAFFANDC